MLNAKAALWEYLADACVGAGEVEEAVQCYATSWRLTSLLFGDAHKDTQDVRSKWKAVKKLASSFRAPGEPSNPAII